MRRAGAVGALASSAIGAPAAHSATIGVTTTGDEYGAGAGCSLREAVQDDASFGGCPAGAGPDVVVLGAGTYTLNRADADPADDEDANATGDLDVAGAGTIEITGAGPASTRIAAASANRLIHLPGSATLRVAGLTLAAGDIRSATGQDAWGGAVRTLGGDVTLDDVRIFGGRAVVGGAIYTANSTDLLIRDSTIEGNVARIAGALGFANSTEATIERSLIRDNAADAGAGNDAEGGAIRHTATTGSLTIRETELTGNTAATTGAADWASGGAIRSIAPLTIERSLIADNVATAAAGTVEHGGALFASGATTIVNSTFKDNEAAAPNGRGGAIYVSGGTATARHVTFSTNTSAVGDHVYADAPGSLTLAASIIPGLIGFGPDPCGGDAVTSGGHNVAISADPGCGFGGTDVTTLTLGFADGGALGDHGGSTRTIAITDTSSAVDAVPVGSCAPAGGTDQRGAPFARPSGAACDAGAFELQVAAPGGGGGGGGGAPVPPGDGPPQEAAPSEPPAAAPVSAPALSISRVALDRRRGRAVLIVRAPGPGRVILRRGPGVRRDAERTSSAARVRLAVRPRGWARARLLRRGQAVVRLRVTFAPAQGAPETVTRRVRLVRRGAG